MNSERNQRRDVLACKANGFSQTWNQARWIYDKCGREKGVGAGPGGDQPPQLGDSGFLQAPRPLERAGKNCIERVSACTLLLMAVAAFNTSDYASQN